MPTRLLVGLIISITAAGCFAFGHRTTGMHHALVSTTVILVRHAEKGTEPRDARGPDLCPTGIARAAALDTALADASVSAIYVTDMRRTQQTAAPLAQRIGLVPTIVPASTHATDLANRILTEPEGQTVLVIGHSNTVPQIIEALGGPGGIVIADTEYDNMYVLTLHETRAPTLLRARYGDVSRNPPCPE